MATRDDPAKRSWLVISFRYGDPAAPTFARYTDYTRDVVEGMATFNSKPQTAVKIPPFTGGFNEQPLVVELPLDAFTTRISNGEPHSPIDVTVVETMDVPSLDLSAAHLDTMFKGRVDRAVRNHKGRRGIVAVYALNWKSRVRAALGIPALNECVWPVYGDGKGCRAIPVAVAGEVTEIVDNRVAIRKPGGVDPLDGRPDRFFHRGRIVRDGLSIDVKDWSNSFPENPDHFYLDDFAPQDWLGRAVTVVEGCPRTVAACRAKGQEARFMGIGIAIPDRNPVLEGGV